MKMPIHHEVKLHRMKVVVTVGCVLSTVVCVYSPSLGTHAQVIALSTNLIWIWAV